MLRKIAFTSNGDLQEKEKKEKKKHDRKYSKKKGNN